MDRIGTRQRRCESQTFVRIDWATGPPWASDPDSMGTQEGLSESMHKLHISYNPKRPLSEKRTAYPLPIPRIGHDFDCSLSVAYEPLFAITLSYHPERHPAATATQAA